MSPEDADLLVDLSDLKLRLRTRNRLEANGVHDVADFMRLTRGQVTGWHQTGEVVWQDISAAQSHVLALAGEDQAPGASGPQDAGPVAPVTTSTQGPKRTGPTTVLELIDWAIDSVAFDKDMCRKHLVEARRLLEEGKT